ncbi:MAG: GNAT family N-acetyltransferase [Candidatus Paceibacterota bacterium]|jgi:GNAT superfamily N-acetyltransferase
MIVVEKPIGEDVQGIEDVFYKTWLLMFPNQRYGITEEDIREYFKDIYSDVVDTQITKYIFSMPENELFLVAKENEVVVGICRAKKGSIHNELDVEYVLPEYQGRGVGSLFWEKVKNFLGNEKDTIVRVPIYNKRAIKFYTERGFVDTGKQILDERLRMPVSKNIIPEVELVLKAHMH